MDVETVEGTSSGIIVDEYNDFNFPTAPYSDLDTVRHSCRCRHNTCYVPTCKKTKSVIRRVGSCKNKTNSNCFLCNKIVLALGMHTQSCKDENCVVPHCKALKRIVKPSGGKNQNEMNQRGKSLAREVEQMTTEPIAKVAVSAGIEKPWQVYITDNVRNHLICKLAQAETSVPIADLLITERETLLTHVGELELDLYKKSAHRVEYYIGIAELIYQFTTETEEKKSIALDERME